MPSALTRLATPVRGLSLKDCDPERLVAPSSCILDGGFSSSSSSNGDLDIDIDCKVQGQALNSNLSEQQTSQRRAKRWEVTVKDGIVTTKQVDVEETEDESEEEVHDISEHAQLCEAVLRSVFAVSLPVRSLEDRLADAETVSRAFAIDDQSVLHTVLMRAQKAAQYRRAELQFWSETLQTDGLPYINPDQFEDPQVYASWKQGEMQEVSMLITKLEGLPSFSGSVQVDLISVSNLKPLEVGCASPFTCSKQAQLPQIYSSVTVLPARSGSGNFSSMDGKEPTPAFLTEVITGTGSAEWQASSPWISISSVQDKVLIEVWNKKLRQPSIKRSKSKLRKFLKRSSSRRKVSAWNGDPFIGQVIVSFSHIESQALRHGVLKGKAPSMSYMLADEKGRQKSSTIQLQFSCSCERLYREFPSNKLFLRPPVSDILKAFDAVALIGYKSQKEGAANLSPQWKRIVAGFGFHYRIRKQRCSLGLVTILARSFQHSLDMLANIVEEWSPVCQAAREGKLTRDELALHTTVVSMLVKPAIDAVENFQAVFPGNQPPGALPYLLKLLGLVLRWDPDPNEILIPLTSWIKNSCEKRFYHHLFGDMVSVEQPTSISVQTLTTLIRLVCKDLTELQTAFKDTFPEAIFLPGIAIPVYYKLVSAYVVNAIRAAQVKVFTKDCEDLITELLTFHHEIELVDENCELMDLHSVFQDHITQLVSAARTRMIDWVSSSVSSEKWEPLSLQTGALFSFSVVDLYFMLGEVMDEMMTRLTVLPFGHCYFQQVEDAICTAVKTYVEILEKLCLRELPEETTKEKRGLISCQRLPSELCISKSLCVKMNNMNAVLEQHQDLEKRLQEVHVKTNEGLRELESQTETDAMKLSLFKILERHGSAKDGLNPRFRELYQFTEQTIVNVMGSVVEILQGQIAHELQCVLDAPNSNYNNLEQQFQPLTTYLDQHLSAMNDYLHPSMFQKLITEICKALIFCLEEFALNRDEDPNPMTQKQRQLLEDSLDFFYDYFYGDGAGLTSDEMNVITARLRRILSCWDLDTRELCSLYWKAWDQFNSHECVQVPDTDCSNETLHLLDYLWLLKQRTDDEAREIVSQQNFIANKRMMQFMFGLPKEEELVASYFCRNSQKMQGTLYVTSKHLCFADTKMSLADSRALQVIPIDRIMRIDVAGKSSIVLISFNQRPQQFSKLSDRDAVCQTIFDLVRGSGSHLEKSMAPIWGSKAAEFPSEAKNNAIKVFKCWRQSMLHKYSGTLLVSAAYILFTQDDKQKIIQMDHASISRIHAERRGLRPSGVVVELKNGEDYEFCEFQGCSASNKEIAKELNKLVFAGAANK